MLGLWIKKYLTTDDKRKLRDFKYAYNLNAQDDGAAMLFLIVKMMQPDTHAGCSDIKYKLENMKMSHFKREIPKSNLQIEKWMNEISIVGEKFRNVKAEIHPLLHLIMPTLQGIHGDQEGWVGGGQGFHSRACEGHGTEEV